MSANEIEAAPIWQTDPARAKRLMIVHGQRRLIVAQHGNGIRLIDEDEVYPEDALGVLADRALGMGCASVWMVPPHAADWLQEARQLLADPPAWLNAHPLSNPKSGALSGIIVQRPQGGVPMGVYIVDSGDPWALAGKLRGVAAEEIAEGLFLAARLLGMQLRFSPSYVGVQILRQELARKPYAIPPLSEWARELVTAHRPTYVQWSRPILASGPQVIHKYDRNSSFVASAGEVPVGDPVPTAVFMPGRPGLYRISAVAPTLWQINNPLVPSPFQVGDGAGSYPSPDCWPREGIWAWEPQIRQARREGWEIGYHEGYYWPVKHDLFRTWRDRLSAARLAGEELSGPAARIARAIIKRVGVATIGRLNQRRARAMVPVADAQERGLRILHRELDEQGDWTGLAEVLADFGREDLLRPDWWGTIIANANERLFAQLYAHLDAAPVAAYVDAVYCLHPWPEGDLQPSQLGKWKLEHDIYIPAGEVEQLNTLTPAAWVKRLAAIARGGAPSGAGSGADDGEEETDALGAD